jgi:hypothetical protein
MMLPAPDGTFPIVVFFEEQKDLMNDYDNSHDGDLEGVWVDQSTAYVFLSTVMKERFAVVADGVVALTVTNFKQGNLIFEVSVRGHEELTMDDIAALYGLREGKDGEEQAAKLQVKARQERLSILEIIPSYGATCLLLAHSIKIIDQNEWSARYLSRATGGPDS